VKAKKLISLISIELNQHFKISKTKYDLKNKKSEAFTMVIVIVALGFTAATMLPLYIEFMRNSLMSYASLNLKELFISNAIMISGFFGLFLGLFILIAEFFFSKDMRVLVSLPLKPQEVIFSKLFLIIFDQMIISLVILLPALIYYGISTSASWYYYIYALIIFLLSQVFALTLLTIFILPISRIFKSQKNKDFMIFFASILFMALAFLFVYFMNSNLINFSDNPQEFYNQIVGNQNILNKMSAAFPPAFLAVKALSTSGFMSFVWILLYAGMNIGLFIMALFMGKRFYYDTYSELQQNASNKKVYTKDSFEKIFSKQNTPLKAFEKREWRYFLRVPAFSINGFMNVLIFPILIIISSSFSALANDPEMKFFLDIIHNFKDYLVPIGILASVLGGGINGLSYSLFSREGSYIKELKILPISPKQILRVKFKQIMLLSLIGVITMNAVIAFIGKFNIIQIIVQFLASVLTITFINLAQMVIDTKKPVLEWDNPQKAMKQNINGLLGILIVFGYVAGFGFLGYLLNDVLPIWSMTLILALIAAIGSFILYKEVVKSTEKLLSKDL
jgi:ABC-2 type transport system permease protein